MSEPIENWSTSDLTAAAFAVTCGLELERVDPGIRADFVFRAGPGWLERLATFMHGDAQVEPRRFWSASRACRRALLDGDYSQARDLAELARMREGTRGGAA